MQDLLTRLPAAEREESAIDETDSGIILALDHDGQPVSASGYRKWPCNIAHVAVATAPDTRRQGYGFAAALSVIELAISQGLLPQWRAAESNPTSIVLANHLGLEVMGRQFSFRLK